MKGIGWKLYAIYDFNNYEASEKLLDHVYVSRLSNEENTLLNQMIKNLIKFYWQSKIKLVRSEDVVRDIL